MIYLPLEQTNTRVLQSQRRILTQTKPLRQSNEPFYQITNAVGQRNDYAYQETRNHTQPIQGHTQQNTYNELNNLAISKTIEVDEYIRLPHPIKIKKINIRSVNKRSNSLINPLSLAQINRIQKTGIDEKPKKINNNRHIKNTSFYGQIREKRNKFSVNLISQPYQLHKGKVLTEHYKTDKKINMSKNNNNVQTQQACCSSPQFRLNSKLSTLRTSKKLFELNAINKIIKDGKEQTRFEIKLRSHIKRMNMANRFKIKANLHLSSKPKDDPFQIKEQSNTCCSINNKIDDEKQLFHSSTSGDDKSQKGCLKIKSKILIKDQLISYIKDIIDIHKSIKIMTIFNKQWRQKTFQNQSYCCQFQINDKFIGLAITSLLPTAIYRLQLWAFPQNTSEIIQKLCLDKYLQYLIKCSTKNSIHFKGKFNKSIKDYGFIHLNQDVYTLSIQPEYRRIDEDIQSFLNIKCSNINFKNQKNRLSLLQSDQIQGFSVENHYVHQGLALCRRPNISNQLAMHLKISDNIKDVQSLNRLLEDERLDAYLFDSISQPNNIKALRLALNAQFLSNFVCSNKCFKLKGQQIHKTDRQTISKFDCFSSNIKMYLSKGISIDKFTNFYKSQPIKQKQYAINFFNKQLYGKLPAIDEEEYYGYWQFTLFWKDIHFGKINHDFTHLQRFGQQRFLVSMQIQDTLCYMFYVDQTDLL